ncbi:MULTISPECIES: DUF1963 domain-containing protein [unclassified Streptomyces]|uniref:DUF1963 domain-containing protein n=1 Tax=unclassified Streptomyces TaxID=2593676 RepID=UPI002475C87F|nr:MULTISPECIES: DUF1963 domain-containing protein [unclassified Streptomyces]
MAPSRPRAAAAEGGPAFCAPVRRESRQGLTSRVDPPVHSDQAHGQEAERWLLLSQFHSDGDAGMEWGDVAALYWLIRPEDLAAHRFGQVPLTMQCM